MTQGCNPYFILGSFFIFLAVIHLFVTAYLSKSLNLNEKSSKMIKIQYTDPKPGCIISLPSTMLAPWPAPEPLAGPLSPWPAPCPPCRPLNPWPATLAPWLAPEPLAGPLSPWPPGIPVKAMRGSTALTALPSWVCRPPMHPMHRKSRYLVQCRF